MNTRPGGIMAALLLEPGGASPSGLRAGSYPGGSVGPTAAGATVHPSPAPARGDGAAHGAALGDPLFPLGRGGQADGRVDALVGFAEPARWPARRRLHAVEAGARLAAEVAGRPQRGERRRRGEALAEALVQHRRDAGAD